MTEDQPQLIEEPTEGPTETEQARRDQLREIQLDDSKRQMADYLPGGKKYSGALFSGEKPETGDAE